MIKIKRKNMVNYFTNWKIIYLKLMYLYNDHRHQQVVIWTQKKNV